MIQIPIDDKYGIRSFKSDDKNRLIELANNSRVSAYLLDAFPFPYTEQDAESWLEIAIGHNPQTLLVITENDRLIGGTGFYPKNDVYHLSAEIGYWLGETYWGKGIASKTVHTLVNYIFMNTHLLRLYAGVFSNNPASARVLEKNGFVREGYFRKSIIKRNEILDEVRYGLLRQDWMDAFERT